MKTLPDYRAGDIARRNKHALKLAKKLGLVTASGISSGAEQLPQSLCQAVVASERMLAQEAMKRFAYAADEGQTVLFLTICRPEWTCDAGQLSPALISEVRNWMSRRARNLTVHGQQRMLGFVDIAWNDRSAIGLSSHWNVHAHVLFLIENNPPTPRRSVRSAFRCQGDGDRVAKPVYVRQARAGLDVFRVGEYNSRALLLEHHQRRRSYVDRNGQLQTRDMVLASAQAQELAAVVHQLGPQKFWILSGLRRKHGQIMLHDNARERSKV